MKGKHGASAEARHRIEALEAEVAQLRHTLGRAEAERDKAAEQLRQQEERYAAERRALVADVEMGTSRQLRDARDDLARERAERSAEREGHAREVFATLQRHKSAVTRDGWEDLAAIFGMEKKYGELLVPDGTRSMRRMGRNLGVIKDLDQAPSWAVGLAGGSK